MFIFCKFLHMQLQLKRTCLYVSLMQLSHLAPLIIFLKKLILGPYLHIHISSLISRILFLILCLSHQSELSPFIAFDCCVFQVYFDIKHLLRFPFYSGFWFVWETWHVFWMMSYTVDLAEGFLMVPLFTSPLFSLPPVEAGLNQVLFCLQGLGNQPGSSRWRQMKPSVFPRTATQEIVLCDLLWGRR